MKNILIILLLLTANVSYGQLYNYFAVGRTTDTATTPGSLMIPYYLRLPTYATTDTNKVIGLDASGKLVLRTKTTSSGGGVTTQQLADSVALRVKYTDTATMLANYAIEAQILGYLGLKLDIADSGNAYYTVYGVDTANQNIRNEIAALPIPYFGDSIAVLYDSIAAHNTRLLTWEHSAAFDITSSDIADWDNAYSNRITSLTTTGSSGAATLISNVLNIPDYSTGLSGYVPYTGATTNVDLGAYNLKTDRVNTDTLEPNTSAGLHIHNTSHQDILIAGAGGGQTMTIYASTNLDPVKIQNSTDTVLTTNSSGTIGKAAIASVYLKSATAASTYQPIGTYFTNSDTSNTVSTRAWRQKAVDSLNAQDALRVKYTDTSGMLAPYLRTVNAVTATSTTTLTNKRWTARVTSTTTVSATPSINTDNQDIWKVTAQTADITNMSTNLSGTPVDGDILEIQITGTAARAITWGTSFVSSTVTLPTTTTTTATLTVILQYYTTSSYGNNKWVCVNYF